MQRVNALVLIGRLATGAAVAAATAGCAPPHVTPAAAPNPHPNTTFTPLSREDVFAARLQAMAAADTYVTIVSQATDEVRARTKRPEVVDWAMEQRINTAMAAYTNATGFNGYVALLDMMVLSSLKVWAVEGHWIPDLLHEEGKSLLEAYKRGERDVWDRGAKVLSKKQLDEMRELIAEWRENNPKQYYVGWIRFADFASSLKLAGRLSSKQATGSVLGLLYLDPLAGLDPVTRELQEYRALSERLNFLFNRLPIVLGWQVDLALRRASTEPELVRLVDNTGKFADNSKRVADATTRFSAAIVKFPQDLSAERKAAIEQIDTATTRQVKSALDQSFAGIAEQRQAIVRDLEGRESRLDATLEKARGVVERAREAGRSLNESTSQTIAAARESARGTLDLAFVLAVAFVFATLALLLLYRIAVTRLVLRKRAVARLEATSTRATDGVPRPAELRPTGPTTLTAYGDD
jgi:hypothetical protein